MKRRSHLVVRVIPESSVQSRLSFDFIELCGSDLAACSEVMASDTRQDEKDRAFASSTFNSLSKALIQLSTAQGGSK